MEIITLHNIKHDVYSFEAGKKYNLPDAVALYFINNGWAVAEDGEVALPQLTQEHVLEVQSSSLGHNSQGV